MHTKSSFVESYAGVNTPPAPLKGRVLPNETALPLKGVRGMTRQLALINSVEAVLKVVKK